MEDEVHEVRFLIADPRWVWQNGSMKTLEAAPENILTAQDEKYAAVVAKLTRLGVRIAPRYGWKESFGSMKDCEHFDEAIRLGAEWREQMNREEA
jgi:hypothetical protein